ncbi:MAG: YncE family protein [Mycobacteriaceae bacterium]
MITRILSHGMQLVKFSPLTALLMLAALLTAPNTAYADIDRSGGEIYIPEIDSDTVSVLDVTTGRINQTIPINNPIGPSRPAVLAKTPDGSKVYTDNFGALSPSITIIDRKNNNSTRTIPVESVPLGIFTSGDGKEIYIPEVGFVVEVLDIETDTIVRRLRFADIPAGAMTGPDGLMYIGFVSGLIGAYDPYTGAVVKPPIWSGGTATFWYSFTHDGSKLYTDTINSVGVIDVHSWTLTKTLSTWPDGIGRLTNPGAFTSEISPNGKKLYVSLAGGTGVLVFDTETDELIRTIPTEGYTIGLTFSGDGTRGYIADCGPSSIGIPGPIGELTTFVNWVTVGAFTPGTLITFDPSNDQIISTIPTGIAPGVPLWLPRLTS